MPTRSNKPAFAQVAEGLAERAADPEAAQAQQVDCQAEGAASSASLVEPPSRGSVVELTCNGLSSTGAGVCRTSGGFVVFVPRAVPGEQLTAEIHKLEKGSAVARKVEVLAPSPHAVQPPCPHFAECGGCTAQHMAYEAQLQAKHQRVVELMRRVGGVASIDGLMREPVGCGEPYRYRNKMTFTCSTSLDALEKKNRAQLAEAPTVGLYSLNDPSALVSIEECWLQTSEADRILAVARAHIPAIQTKGKLVVEKLTIKRGAQRADGGWAHLLVLHTWVRVRPEPLTPEEAAVPYQELVQALKTEMPSISIFECRAVLGREKAFPVLATLHGRAYTEHTVAGLTFRASPLAFFQTNVHQAAVLVDMVHAAAGLRRGDLLVDMYCGVGLLGVSLARRQLDARQPVRLAGFDIYNKSVQDARANAKRAGLDEKLLDFRAADLGQPNLGVPAGADVIIVDPARSGLAPSTVEFLRRCNARTLVYVSCDAATQARDVGMLTAENNPRSWQLESVQVCDMFPQTAHTESVALLRRDVRSLPEYVKPGKGVTRKFKPQRLHKAVVHSADLPWIDGGNLSRQGEGVGP